MTSGPVTGAIAMSAIAAISDPATQVSDTVNRPSFFACSICANHAGRASAGCDADKSIGGSITSEA